MGHSFNAPEKKIIIFKRKLGYKTQVKKPGESLQSLTVK